MREKLSAQCSTGHFYTHCKQDSTGTTLYSVQHVSHEYSTYLEVWDDKISIYLIGKHEKQRMA